MGSADGAKQGEVVDCIHSAKTVNSGEGTAQTDNKYYDPSTAVNYRNGSFTKAEFGDTLDNTASRPVVAVNHVLYLRKQGYINYIPFQGRMSAFYYSSWMKWDPLKQLTGVASVQGMGRCPRTSITLHKPWDTVSFLPGPRREKEPPVGLVAPRLHTAVTRAGCSMNHAKRS